MNFSTPTKWALQLILIFSHVVGLILFLKGFFPSKVVLPGYNSFYESSSPFAVGYGGKPQFDKVIVMVVDAMRSDFFYSESMSHMTFLHKLINDGNAVPFTAFSNPPTVTLPRLKGITTGGTPSFLDAILNIADDKDDSQGLNNQDSWVHQFKSKGKLMNFYGDDTWLKLFPTTFTRVDGTNSFFVSDFTEVDNNVTRHLDTELNSKDWDGLVLHYLGLDHIGHKGGPNSKYMKPKIQEMDSILERLYSYAENSKEKTLIVFMGDHGMNEMGNHGGSAIGEVSPGLALISPVFSKLKLGNKAPLPDSEEFSFYGNIQQIDLVPTLASLLDFPIPKNSLGIITRSILPLWKESQQKQILWENCQQMMDLFVAKYGIESDEKILLAYNLLKQKDQTIDSYYAFLTEVQEILATSSTNYNYTDVFRGYGVIFVSMIITFISFNYYFFKQSSVPVALTAFYEIITFVYSLHFHGSSLIEEEHHIWWFITIISVVFLYVYTRKQVSRKTLWFFGLLLLGLRVIRSWNNSGQKWSSKSKFGIYLLYENPNLLWALVVATYFVLAISVHAHGDFSRSFNFLNSTGNDPNDFKQVGSLISFMFIFVGTSVSFLFKLLQYYNDGHEMPVTMKWIFKWIIQSYQLELDSSLSDAAFKLKLQTIIVQMSKISSYFILAFIVVRLVLGKFSKSKGGLITDITNIITLYLIHHSRHENIPMILVFLLVKYSFTHIIINTDLSKNVDQLILIVSLFTICFQNLSFFSFGNTNLLATVDLSNAYNGIEKYDVLPVGILTFISSYVGPIYWSLSSLQMIFEPSVVIYNRKKTDLTYYNMLKQSVILVKSKTTLLFYAISAVGLIGSCINLRFHLFIWTVFSPRLLYFASWSVLMNLLVDLIVALIIIIALY